MHINTYASKCVCVYECAKIYLSVGLFMFCGCCFYFYSYLQLAGSVLFGETILLLSFHVRNNNKVDARKKLVTVKIYARSNESEWFIQRTAKISEYKKKTHFCLFVSDAKAQGTTGPILIKFSEIYRCRSFYFFWGKVGKLEISKKWLSSIHFFLLFFFCLF